MKTYIDVTKQVYVIGLRGITLPGTYTKDHDVRIEFTNSHDTALIRSGVLTVEYREDVVATPTVVAPIVEVVVPVAQPVSDTAALDEVAAMTEPVVITDEVEEVAPVEVKQAPAKYTKGK